MSDAVLEAQLATQRAESFQEFSAAVRAAQAGNYGPGKALIERARAAGGDDVAERVRKELKACAARWKA